jgi:cytochrome b561
VIANTQVSWGLVSRLLHWLVAVLIVALVGHGWWMTEFPARDARFGHYEWHAAVGYLVLGLTIGRLAWRLGNPVPKLPASPAWERAAAHVSHWFLYALMLGVCIEGWALAGTFRRPLDSVFGLATIRPLVTAQDRTLHERLEQWHAILAWSLAALVVVHVAAAVWHKLVRKDDVMDRMFRTTEQR